MKKILLILTLTLLSIVGLAQNNTVTLIHSQYKSSFDTIKHYPVKVEWWLTKAKTTCTQPLPRKDQFQPDPKLLWQTDLFKSYSGSVFDRGHMCDALDNECSGSIALMESFYYSNMAPQYPALNRGKWKTLEDQSRTWAKQYDSVHIWAGSYGEKGWIGKVAIPTNCWKIIYIKKTGKWYFYVFANELIPSTPAIYQSANDIEKLIGFKLNLK